MKTISAAIVLFALASPAPAAEQFALCHGGHRIICVVDGDTFWLDGEKIRVADIDTPETQKGQYKCQAEKALGDRATRRFIELLNVGPFELRAWQRDRDRAGRKLRIVVRDGRSLGDQLVGEGLARTWKGRREPWC
ncbi:MAG: nuclease [Marmoricola sp.]|nr:nuclease [Marmoricola sp.]